MSVALAWYEQRGFDVVDVHSVAPWDLTARKPGHADLRIEVKGTTGTGTAVIVTNGEKEHASGYSPTVLVVVSGITLGGTPAASAAGGRITCHLNPWRVTQGRWTPTVWRYEPG